MTPRRGTDVPEVLSVQQSPSEEVRRIPDPPTVTKSPFPQVTPQKSCNVPVVVELSVLVVLDELLDEVQDMEMKLKRNTEKIMSRCLIRFPIVWFQQYPNHTINRFDLQESGDFDLEGIEEGSQFFHEIRLQFLLSLTPFRFIMKIGTLLSHSKKVMRTRQELI